MRRAIGGAAALVLYLLTMHFLVMPGLQLEWETFTKAASGRR